MCPVDKDVEKQWGDTGMGEVEGGRCIHYLQPQSYDAPPIKLRLEVVSR